MVTTKRGNQDAEGESPWRGAASQSGRSAYELPLVTCINRKKKGKMSERSELFSLPDLCLASTGTPQRGAANRGRLSLLTFFGEAKKVSGCRAAPGKVDRRKNNLSYPCKQGWNRTPKPSAAHIALKQRPQLHLNLQHRRQTPLHHLLQLHARSMHTDVHGRHHLTAKIANRHRHGPQPKFELLIHQGIPLLARARNLQRQAILVDDGVCGDLFRLQALKEMLHLRLRQMRQ